MPYPDALLHRGEKVVVRKHPSGKTLVLPTVWFLLIVAGASAMIAWSRSWTDSGFTSHTQWLIAILVIAFVLLIWLVIVPIVRWKTEHFVLSTAHIFFRTGILRRREHQIPLSRIQNIETDVSFWGRILGYGSLIVESAAEQPLEFDNVASISKVQSTLNQLIADDRRRHSDDGEGMPLYSGVDDDEPADAPPIDPPLPPRRATKSRYTGNPDATTAKTREYPAEPEQSGYPAQGPPQHGYQQQPQYQQPPQQGYGQYPQQGAQQPYPQQGYNPGWTPADQQYPQGRQAPPPAYPAPDEDTSGPAR